MLKVNTWNLSNEEYFTPKVGEPPVGGDVYVTFDIPDLTIVPYSYLWSDTSRVSASEVGNSFEIVAIFDDKGTGSHATMYIDDGTNRAGIHIAKDLITSIDGQQSITVANTDGNTHRYTLTLQNGIFTILFDTNVIASYTVTAPTEKKQLLVGFPESQNGAATLKMQYIKYTSGVYKYIKASDIDFELLIDTVDTFDSPNLKTYTKASFDTIPSVPDNWSPVSLICGNYTGTGYDFKGLVQAATVHMPPKQDQDIYTFYYKVRFNGPSYVSDWSQTYLTERVKPTPLTLIPTTEFQDTPLAAYSICKRFTSEDNGYHALVPPQDNTTAVLPGETLTDGWTLRIYNASDYHLQVITSDPFELTTIDPWNITTFVYVASTDSWSFYTEQRVQTYVLPPNITNTVFDAVYHYRIPAYDDVYTKAFDSGVVADITKGKAVAVDEFFGQLVKQKGNISSFTADRDDFNERWKSIFGLDNSLFKNSAEMRDAFQVVIKNLKGEMLKTALEVVIEAITGAKPDIIEYKDRYFNILWSYNTIKKLPVEQTYYLYDEEHPSFRMQPFIVYGGSDKAFTWEIDIYDPYNLKYNQDLITGIIEMFKPAYSFAVVKFYSYEGVPYTKRYYYGIDNYLRSEYNK